MALLPELQTQLWATIEHNPETNGIFQAQSLQTTLPHITGIIDNQPQLHNDSRETLDFDFDLACYNEQNTLGHFITMLLYGLVCIVGLFGNTLVIYVVLRFSKMQTVTNIYILNLAIADECFLIGIPFLLYTMQKGSWQFGEYICKAYMVSTSITQFTSSIFLLIMAADRYIAVCHPISVSPRYRTALVAKIVSALAWLTSALFMLPVMLFANSVQVGDHVSCNIKWPEAHSSQSDSTFILYSLTLGFAVPLAFIMGFYCLVIRKLQTVELKHKSKEKKRSHRKVTKLVLTVIAVYILCWLPYWIAQLVLINTKVVRCASAIEIMIFLLVGCLGYSNSAMNPLLYAFLSDNFKKSFLRAFSCPGVRKDAVTGDLQAERSILPKWGSRKNDMSQCDDAEASSVASNRKQVKKFYGSNTSHFLGTSTAGGTGITATSIVDDGNSEVTPLEPLCVTEREISVIICSNDETSSHGNQAEQDLLEPNGLVGQTGDGRPPVLQTDL